MRMLVRKFAALTIAWSVNGQKEGASARRSLATRPAGALPGALGGVSKLDSAGRSIIMAARFPCG